MHWFDVGVGIALLIGSVWSFFRGLIREILSIFGIVAAFVLASRGYPYVAQHLESVVTQMWLRQALGFGLIFLTTTVVYVVLARLLLRLVKAVGLSLPNRMLGGLFGFVKVGVVIAALLLITAQFYPTFATGLATESQLAPAVFRVADALSTLLPAGASDEFHQVYNSVRRKLPPWIPAPAPVPSEPQANTPRTLPQNPDGISESDSEAVKRIILRERRQKQ